MFAIKPKRLWLILGFLFVMTIVMIAFFKFNQKERRGMSVRLSPAWEHGPLREVFSDVFVVTGTNKIVFEGQNIQTSRNMTVVRSNNDLTLINSVRLSEEGLQELEALGSIKHIVRIGAFHGRDDAFYQTKYGASLWALKEMGFSHGEQLNKQLDKDSSSFPIKGTHIIVLKTTKHPEALLLLANSGGILVSCDSIKNWKEADQYFSNETATSFREQGLFGVASIDQVWMTAMEPDLDDLNRIITLDFKHLISAHGEVIKGNAHDRVKASIEKLLLEK